MAALLTPRRQNLAASHRFHACAEAVRLVATPDLRLKRTLGQRMLLWGAARGGPWKQLVYATRQGGSSNLRGVIRARQKYPTQRMVPSNAPSSVCQSEKFAIFDQMTKLCTYVVTKDTGLAPNPYWNFCTVAVCTPNRQHARLSRGDWIVGVLSKRRGHRFLYSMEVQEVLDRDKYFRDIRFERKKPNLRGNWRERCGDNFDSRAEDGTWIQHRNRFHLGPKYLAKDTRHSDVFVASRFWYLGRSATPIPEIFASLIGGRGIRTNHDERMSKDFRRWIVENFTVGVHGLPNDNPDI